jgi:arylsulfatase A-like enzyme
MLGDHRFLAKDLPYQHSTEVPMAIRWDGHVDPGVSSRVTTNVDLTATIVEAAGLKWVTEGRSVLSRGRAGTVLEQMSSRDSLGRRASQDPGREHPAYCGWRSRRYLFVEWDQGYGREFYDYATDPDELDNALRDPAYQNTIQRMRSKAKQHCSPTPYGFSWK